MTGRMAFHGAASHKQGGEVLSPHAHWAETPVSIVTLSYNAAWGWAAMLDIDT
jgi:hypothetical protein